MTLKVKKAETIDIQEFRNYGNHKKKKILLDYWGIEDNLLQGTIESIDDTHFKVSKIASLEGKPLRNIFNNRKLSLNANIERNRNVIDNLHENDDIVFKFIVKNNLLNESAGPINIVDNSIIKVEDIENFYSATDFDIVDIIETIKSNENLKIKKVLANKELFENNAKSIYLNKLNELTKDVNEKKEQLIQENKYLEQIKEKIQNEIDTQQKYLDEINEDLKLGIYEEQRLIKLGILKEKSQKQIKSERVDINRNEYIDYIVKYLGSSYKNNLYYNKQTIEMLFAGLSTNQLVILSGSPGTGKTSLVEGFCNAIGAKKKLISVQPNWSETQDLLGFYNPVEKKYVSTPFLDFLIEADNNPDDFYIVCLDEMNLAHVEYYFAEFLSKLESSDRQLELYSESVYLNNKEDVTKQMNIIESKYNINTDDDISNIDDINIIEKYSDLRSKLKNYLDYKHKLIIPKNIRFIGTINKDETTKNLSPKVVDRSFIMEVDKYNEEVKKDMLNNIEEYKIKYNKVLNLNSSDFRVTRKIIEDNILLKLSEIAEFLEEEFQVNLKNRFFRQTEEIIGSEILNEEKLLDYIVLTKIIPKINIYIEKEDEQKITRFEELIRNLSNSQKAFDKMKSVWKDTEVLTFWR